MRRLRHREVEQLAQGCTDARWLLRCEHRASDSKLCFTHDTVRSLMPVGVEEQEKLHGGWGMDRETTGRSWKQQGRHFS